MGSCASAPAGLSADTQAIILAIRGLGDKVDGLGVTLGSKMDGLGAKMDDLGAKVDGLSAKMDGLSEKLSIKIPTPPGSRGEPHVLLPPAPLQVGRS